MLMLTIFINKTLRERNSKGQIIYGNTRSNFNSRVANLYCIVSFFYKEFSYLYLKDEQPYFYYCLLIKELF